MKTIEIKYDYLHEAAAKLVANAPARGNYWGIQLRARYATTRAADIEAHYKRILAERAYTYGFRLPVSQKKTGTIDADGKRMGEHGTASDQIGWMVPAIPDVEGHGFWGYTSVPEDGCRWWRALPSYPPKQQKRRWP